jgi:hypothetical protein
MEILPQLAGGFLNDMPNLHHSYNKIIALSKISMLLANWLLRGLSRSENLSLRFPRMSCLHPAAYLPSPHLRLGQLCGPCKGAQAIMPQIGRGSGPLRP